MYKIKRYFQGVLKQAKMVRWPKKSELIQAFGVVLLILVVCAVALAIDDYIIANLLKTLDEQLGTSSEAASTAMKMIGHFIK